MQFFLTHMVQTYKPMLRDSHTLLLSAAMHQYKYPHLAHTRGFAQRADLNWPQHWPWIVILASAPTVTPASTVQCSPRRFSEQLFDKKNNTFCKQYIVQYFQVSVAWPLWLLHQEFVTAYQMTLPLHGHCHPSTILTFLFQQSSLPLHSILCFHDVVHSGRPWHSILCLGRYKKFS